MRCPLFMVLKCPKNRASITIDDCKWTSLFCFFFWSNEKPVHMRFELTPSDLIATGDLNSVKGQAGHSMVVVLPLPQLSASNTRMFDSCANQSSTNSHVCLSCLFSGTTTSGKSLQLLLWTSVELCWRWKWCQFAWPECFGETWCVSGTWPKQRASTAASFLLMRGDFAEVADKKRNEIEARDSIAFMMVSQQVVYVDETHCFAHAPHQSSHLIPQS